VGNAPHPPPVVNGLPGLLHIYRASWWWLTIALVLAACRRAFYSLRKVGIDCDDVRMAVCVMRVVPARYAFVIHTKNPSNNDASEVFCELVKGLGESLVSGMVAGSSVAFKARKDALDNPETLSYASKSEGMFVRESLIFRSDSNGEDLEGYAGAGLYESLTMDPSELQRVDYNEDPITADPAFRKKVRTTQGGGADGGSSVAEPLSIVEAGNVWHLLC